MIVGRKQRVAHAALPFRRLEAVEEFLGLFFMQLEFCANGYGITAIKAILGKLLFFHEPDGAVRLIRGPAQRVNTLDVLQEGANTLQAIRKLDRDGVEINAAALLKVGELGDLQAIEKDLPPDAPGAERRRLPIVFFKPNVM